MTKLFVMHTTYMHRRFNVTHFQKCVLCCCLDELVERSGPNGDKNPLGHLFSCKKGWNFTKWVELGVGPRGNYCVCTHAAIAFQNKVFVFCFPFGFPVALPRCKYFHSILKLLILLAPHHIDNPMKLQLHIRPYPIMWDFLQDASCQVFVQYLLYKLKLIV